MFYSTEMYINIIIEIIYIHLYFNKINIISLLKVKKRIVLKPYNLIVYKKYTEWYHQHNLEILYTLYVQQNIKL
jgi:hypothetical protein